MHYYALHEKAYQQLKAQGHASWDQFLGQSSSFEAFGYKDFLEQALAQSVFDSASPNALEIGCGTGPGSCYLASKGFLVEGVDISETAIVLTALLPSKIVALYLPIFTTPCVKAGCFGYPPCWATNSAILVHTATGMMMAYCGWK